MRRSPWVPRIALAAVAIGVGYAVVSLSIGQGGPTGVKIQGAETQELYAGIEQDGASLGPKDSDVSIGVFTDLQCAPCADYQVDTVDPLVDEYARPGKARMEFHNLSLGAAETTLAAHAAVAAGDQGYEWQYADLFFRNQHLVRSSRVTESFLNDIAASMGNLDFEQWRDARDSPDTAARVDADAKLADSLKLPTDAPSVVVDGPGGPKVLTDFPSQEEVEAAVRAESG